MLTPGEREGLNQILTEINGLLLTRLGKLKRREQQKSQADKKDKQNGEGDAGGG